MINENQSLATTGNDSENSLATLEMETGFVPQNREQFEMIRELQEAAAALDGLEMPKATSKDLAASGEVFDIVDAITTTIEQKQNGQVIPKRVVVFMIESNTRTLTAVMKDGNSINIQYAEFFSKFKAIGRPQRKVNMQFVEATWLPKTSGNHPVILRKAEQGEKVVGKGK